MKYDDDLIKAIDHDMGWDDPPEKAPSAMAASLGCHCKFIDSSVAWPFSGMAWVNPGKVWSVTILNQQGIKTTLLARSFSAVKQMYYKLCDRSKQKNKTEYWNSYYSKMWKRRYRKWCCKAPQKCNCQLCRMANKSLNSDP